MAVIRGLLGWCWGVRGWQVHPLRWDLQSRGGGEVTEEQPPGALQGQTVQCVGLKWVLYPGNSLLKCPVTIPPQIACPRWVVGKGAVLCLGG